MNCGGSTKDITRGILMGGGVITTNFPIRHAKVYDYSCSCQTIFEDSRHSNLIKSHPARAKRKSLETGTISEVALF